MGAVLGAAVAVGVMWLAVLAPSGHMDRPIPDELPTAELRLEDLLRRIDPHYGFRGDPLALPEVIVRLPSRQPTWRQIDKALRRDARMSLSIGYCGTGATLLLGGAPMGGPQLDPLDGT